MGRQQKKAPNFLVLGEIATCGAAVSLFFLGIASTHDETDPHAKGAGIYSILVGLFLFPLFCNINFINNRLPKIREYRRYSCVITGAILLPLSIYPLISFGTFLGAFLLFFSSLFFFAAGFVKYLDEKEQRTS